MSSVQLVAITHLQFSHDEGDEEHGGVAPRLVTQQPLEVTRIRVRVPEQTEQTVAEEYPESCHRLAARASLQSPAGRDCQDKVDEAYGQPVAWPDRAVGRVGSARHHCRVSRWLLFPQMTFLGKLDPVSPSPWAGAYVFLWMRYASIDRNIW